MSLIDQIAEKKIAEALEKGELENLPGAGKPLKLYNDRMVPAELRVAYRVLKNAGFLPPQALARKEVASVESLIAQAVSDGERAALKKRLGFLLMQLDSRGSSAALLSESAYFERIKGKVV